MSALDDQTNAVAELETAAQRYNDAKTAAQNELSSVDDRAKAVAASLTPTTPAAPAE